MFTIQIEDLKEKQVVIENKINEYEILLKENKDLFKDVATALKALEKLQEKYDNEKLVEAI